jgi:hypothetical protein
MRIAPPEPIWLPLRRSRWLAVYLLLLHAAALTALAVLQLPMALRAAGLLALLIILYLHARRYLLLQGRAAVRRAHWRTDGSWWLVDGEGRVWRYRQAEARLVQPWLIVLRLQGGEGARWLLLAGDSASADTLRRLRIRLRRMAAGAGQADPLCGM